MAASFFVGGKHVVSKKTGQVFDFVTVFRLNRFGDWETKTFTCDSFDTLAKILKDVPLGSAVKMMRDDNDDVVSLAIVKDIPPLNLPKSERKEGD